MWGRPPPLRSDDRRAPRSNPAESSRLGSICFGTAERRRGEESERPEAREPFADLGCLIGNQIRGRVGVDIKPPASRSLLVKPEEHAMMKIQPLHRYARPGFPTQYVANTHPELLRLVPKRWRGNPTVLTALGAVCVMLAGCGSKTVGGSSSRVAPLFNHGKGLMNEGGVGTSTQALKESDARRIIADEAKKAGLAFVERRVVIGRLPLPGLSEVRGDQSLDTPRVRTVYTDGVDFSHHVAYEYVSWDDVNSLITRRATATTYKHDMHQGGGGHARGPGQGSPERYLRSLL